MSKSLMQIARKTRNWNFLMKMAGHRTSGLQYWRTRSRRVVRSEATSPGGRNYFFYCQYVTNKRTTVSKSWRLSPRPVQPKELGAVVVLTSAMIYVSRWIGCRPASVAICDCDAGGFRDCAQYPTVSVASTNRPRLLSSRFLRVIFHRIVAVCRNKFVTVVTVLRKKTKKRKGERN